MSDKKGPQFSLVSHKLDDIEVFCIGFNGGAVVKEGVRGMFRVLGAFAKTPLSPRPRKLGDMCQCISRSCVNVFCIKNAYAKSQGRYSLMSPPCVFPALKLMEAMSKHVINAVHFYYTTTVIITSVENIHYRRFIDLA